MPALRSLLRARRHRWLTGITLAALAGTGGFAAAATPPPPKPSVPAGYTITKLAAVPAAANCDDLAFLDGKLFVGCQNSTVSGASSTG